MDSKLIINAQEELMSIQFKIRWINWWLQRFGVVVFVRGEAEGEGTIVGIGWKGNHESDLTW